VWQRTYGSVAGGSEIGTVGGSATMPSNFFLTDNENSIAAEVLYEYEPVFFGSFGEMRNLNGEPLFGEIFQATTFQHNAWARPRGSNLASDPAS
jgi:hypothetical protein